MPVNLICVPAKYQTQYRTLLGMFGQFRLQTLTYHGIPSCHLVSLQYYEYSILQFDRSQNNLYGAYVHSTVLQVRVRRTAYVLRPEKLIVDGSSVWFTRTPLAVQQLKIVQSGLVK